jgi:hypothetical protein
MNGLHRAYPCHSSLLLVVLVIVEAAFQDKTNKISSNTVQHTVNLAVRLVKSPIYPITEVFDFLNQPATEAFDLETS